MKNWTKEARVLATALGAILSAFIAPLVASIFAQTTGIDSVQTTVAFWGTIVVVTGIAALVFKPWKG